MTNEELLKKLEMREAMFRIWARCTECVYWEKDGQGHWHCGDSEVENRHRDIFEVWLKDEAGK